MMDLFWQILRGYDPDKDAIQPRPRKNNYASSERPSDLLSDCSAEEVDKYGRRAVWQTDTKVDWEQVTRNSSPLPGRTSSLTEADCAELADGKGRKFEKKAKLLKPYWAAGMSTRETEEAINKRGYKKSTIAPYFDCFTRAHEKLSKTVQLDN